MKHIIGEQLISIFEEILAEDNSPEEWSEIESDDMFQNESYTGGYDADEEAFCFSHYNDGTEYWFQLTLQEVKDAVSGKLKVLDMVEADL